MKWISVNDRLPAIFNYVLFIENDSVCAGQYVDDHWTDYLRPDAYGDPKDCANVTHWMPLPEPPAVEARAALAQTKE